MERILQVWDRFRGVPCETFTKGWWYRQCGGAPRQRTVAEMVSHRTSFGAGGNCFDLALWLRHELAAAGLPARLIGHDLGTAEAHIAVLADELYLCDPGDLWLQPIAIDAARGVWHSGFFPGRDVQVSLVGEALTVLYRRASGKVGQQFYDLRVLGEAEVQAACHHSQNLLRRPFCEALLPCPETGLVEHWEYDRGQSFWNLATGLLLEAPCSSPGDWAERISLRTGLSADLVLAGFAAYGGQMGLSGA